MGVVGVFIQTENHDPLMRAAPSWWLCLHASRQLQPLDSSRLLPRLLCVLMPKRHHLTRGRVFFPHLQQKKKNNPITIIPRSQWKLCEPKLPEAERQHPTTFTHSPRAYFYPRAACHFARSAVHFITIHLVGVCGCVWGGGSAFQCCKKKGEVIVMCAG